MRKCKKCSLLLPEEDFYLIHRKEKTHIRNTCKKCYIKNNSDRATENRFKIKDGMECLFCGEKSQITLDFHHVLKKEHKMSKLIRSKDSKKLTEEMSKCVVLCANCHRRLHAGEINEFEKRLLETKKEKILLNRRGSDTP